MLQWMGGSRRKVTTSRKSTQKRQKQYFEQRRRQQQQCEAASIENHVDGLVTHDHQEGNRSLDILSLLNVSKVAEERVPQFANETCRVTENMSIKPNKATYEGPFGTVDSTDHYSSVSIPSIMLDKDTTTDCGRRTGTRTPSSHQVGTMSPESTQKNASKIGSTNSEYWKNGSSIQLSILDLIGDEGASGSSEGHPVHEAHAALSLEGLGKLGAETPVQSPQRPGRIRSDDQSSFTKSAKKLHSCKNFNRMLDDLEMEVSPLQECLMQDPEKQSPGSHLAPFPISEDMPYPLSSTDHNRSAVKGSMQLDGKRLEMNPFFDEDRHDNIWNANSPSDGDVVYEECGPNWKNDNATNSSHLWRNYMLDSKFEGCQSPLRYQEKVTDIFDNLDRGGRHSLSPDEPKYSPFTCNYFPQADCSSPPYMGLNDKKDNLTWLSEESCSSSAVRGEDLADLPSARCRRYDKDLQRPLMSNMKENYDEGMWNRRQSTMRREELNRSRKYTRLNLPRSESAYFPEGTFNEELVHDEDSWLLEEGFPLPNTTSRPDSFIQSSEKSGHLGEDLFGTDSQADLLPNSRHSFGRSEKEFPDEFSSENVAFCQPFCSRQSLNISSKTSGGESWMGIHHDLEIHVRSSNSSEVADFFGEAESATTNPDLSAQGSATKEEGEKPMNQAPHPEKIVKVSAGNKNVTPESRLPAGDANLKDYGNPLHVPKNGVPQETPAYFSEDVEETSPLKKIQYELAEEFKSNEWQRVVPALCHPKLIHTDINIGEENPAGPEAKTMSIESSCQLMMFQRCVQLLCVLKS